MGVKARHKQRWRTRELLALTLVLIMAAGAAPSRKNLLTNGGFEKGLSKTDEPVGWHTKLTGVIATPQYTDPANKKGRTGIVHFRCGCGHDWGTVRPRPMLVCPQCKHTNPGLEDSGDLYQRNHEYVRLVRGRHRKAIGMTLPKAVGRAQGVRVISKLVTAKRGEGYEIRVDAISAGPHLRVFVEGFIRQAQEHEQPSLSEATKPEADPHGHTHRLKRVFRKQINIGTPSTWQTFSQRFVPREGYAFDAMFVTLYAYHPGEAAYDNVVLRQLSPVERQAHLKQKKAAKETRLR